MPHDYKRVLAERAAQAARAGSPPEKAPPAVAA
jgi:hypothetical protein